MRRRTLHLLFAAVFCISFANAAEIHVPQDQPTIQAGIAAAVNGDTVIVAPGRYVENVDFLGKAVTLRSTSPESPSIVDQTIIDGGEIGPCVSFKRGENQASVLDGFCLTRGKAKAYLPTGMAGGGIYCMNSSPTIRGNTMKWNQADLGAGVYCGNSNASILGNVIEHNAGGAALYCVDSSVLIDNNSIESNPAGIVLDRDGSSIVRRNYISGNSWPGFTEISQPWL